MIRRALAKSASRPVRPAKPPRPTEAELRQRVSAQVERIQAANVWNNRLATEFEEAEAEMDVVETALSLETFPAEVLRRIIAELKEEVLLIVESHRRLRIEVSELELGAASLKGLVSGLMEGVQLLEDASSAIGELVDRLQQKLADACVEFEMRMISMAHVIAPAVEPAVESSVGSPV
jgi:chromosome segregation ATPase